MKKWSTKYWSEDDGTSLVEKWLNDLPLPQYKAVAKRIFLLEKCGNELKMPHSKSLKQGLFELREPSYGLRVYYCFSAGKIIILLCAGGKKSQAKDIRMARAMIKQLTDAGE